MNKKIPNFTTKAKVSDFRAGKTDEKPLTAQEIIEDCL